MNANTHSENNVVSVSVGESNSRPTTNGAPAEGGGGLFQKHNKYGGNNASYGGGSGGVTSQIQYRNNQTGNSSKYGTISTSDVERREVT